MAQDLSIEREDFVYFSTTRTMNSRLWFINNQKLLERILAFLARYQEWYGVIIYGFIIMGNHYHLLARFPRKNKAAFFKSFNGIVARLTHGHVKQFDGGRLWARRVRSQVLGDNSDIKDRFFYLSLNPVSAGITQKLADYQGYNSFSDAVAGRRRTFRIFCRSDYINRKRFNRKLKISDCVSEHTLTFTRLPGFEDMPKEQYMKMMLTELESRRNRIVEERVKAGRGFAQLEALQLLLPGVKPNTTKTSERNSRRPLILTSSIKLKQRFLEWYFSLLASYREASKRFRAGELHAFFPPGTYRPPSFCPS